MKIKRRERDAILQSLKSGVVPKIGLQYIQVGRKEEISAIIEDLERVEDGGAFIKFIIGKFGSGKSFFLSLTKTIALKKKFVVAQVDITPDHRLHGKDGQARALYAELMQSLSTNAKPNGGALESIIERWISEIDFKIQSNNIFDSNLKSEIYKELKPLQEIVNGYDFINVILKYLEAYSTNSEDLKSNSLKWLKAGYRLKSEASKDLGVKNIISDDNIYEYLKLFAKFVKIVGYSGLIVNIDEMIVLSERLNNSIARNLNYEMLLRILNDCLQGTTSEIGFLFSGTDDFLEDQRRGLYSYEALATRLAVNEFAVNGINDFSGPLIKLENLSQNDFYILLLNIRNVFAEGDESKYLISDEGLEFFMEYLYKNLGTTFFSTPRDSIKKFVNLLSILEKNINLSWEELLEKTEKKETQERQNELDNDLIDFEL
ncbi:MULTISPECIES: ATP-binding protein [Cetobacterium]|uniref:ATP-binding protein n=1 Tax=Cetobacterium TaxID=180162 RepID=UPI0025C17F3E|nr:MULTISPECIES: ATP-binding protein [Cetobacterium]WVJ03436.1 ATP-binding protein [Cetobacterium somerae]